MTSTADIKDTTLRDRMVDIERWIDDGDYVKAARTCAERQRARVCDPRAPDIDVV